MIYTLALYISSIVFGQGCEDMFAQLENMMVENPYWNVSIYKKK
jgi:hypothetical protein